jgi:hypothetical protein
MCDGHKNRRHSENEYFKSTERSVRDRIDEVFGEHEKMKKNIKCPLASLFEYYELRLFHPSSSTLLTTYSSMFTPHLVRRHADRNKTDDFIVFCRQNRNNWDKKVYEYNRLNVNNSYKNLWLLRELSKW